MGTIRVNANLHRRLKRRAAERGLPLLRLVEEYLRAGLDASSRDVTDVSTVEVTTAAAGGGAFDFWARDAERRYGPSDGKPIG